MRVTTRSVAAFGVPLCVVAIAVGAAMVNADRAAPEAQGLTGGQEDEIVRAHNVWRERVDVQPLRWAADLAARAQARAEVLAAHGCFIEHGPLPNDLGENLYHVSPLQYSGDHKDELYDVTATQVVDTWGMEFADYSSEHDTCAWNRQCGHYTQIVWASTREVGCGRSICPTLGQVWVCNYRPRGNIRVLR
jgi:pathogenesis-related protein 1